MQHAIFCGYTNGHCPEGPDQPVFLRNDKENNKKLKRRSPTGSLEWVSADHVNFRNGFNVEFVKADAEARYNQARALENLELSGGMSKSETVMAARHVKDKHNLYTGDDIEPHTRQELDRQIADSKSSSATRRFTPVRISHAKPSRMLCPSTRRSSSSFQRSFLRTTVWTCLSHGTLS